MIKYFGVALFDRVEEFDSPLKLVTHKMYKAVRFCSLYCLFYSHIAQLVEQSAVNRFVVGSSPTVRACPDVDANFLLSRSHYLDRLLLKGEHRYLSR